MQQEVQQTEEVADLAFIPFMSNPIKKSTILV